MLSIKNVHKRFGDVHAMNDINLDLEPGLFDLRVSLRRYCLGFQVPERGYLMPLSVDSYLRIRIY